MDSAEIAKRRLINQRIIGERCDQPEEVVRWMGAMQAQDYQQAVWAVGLRTRAAGLAEVEQAIAGGKIVRTWPQRGTLHFVAAEDAKWMLDVSAQRRLAADATRRRQLELDDQTVGRCGELFQAELASGKRLTRSAMMQLLEDAQISTTGQRGYHLLWYHAQAGLICQGPLDGKEQTFMLLDEWVPTSRQLSREASLAELAGRYFASHGPATLDDFAGWAGLTLTDARIGLDAVQSTLVAEKSEGKAYWLAGDAPDHQMQEATDIHLLPGFDEYLLGYKDRSDVLAVEHAPKVVPGGNGVFFPIIVVNGQVVGTWKRSIKKNAVTITLTPFAPLATPEDVLSAAAGRFSDFLGMPLSVISVEG